jgi:hypothetical protein
VVGSDNKVDLFGAVVMENQTVDGLVYTPSIVSSPITITLTKRNPFGDMKSAVSQFYKDLLLYEPSEQEVKQSLDYIGSGADGEYVFDDTVFLEWASTLSQKQAFQDLTNAVGGHYITMGYWPSKNSMDDALQTYSAIPNYGRDGSGDADGDGYSANQEAIWSTSDTNVTSFPEKGFRFGSYLDTTFYSLPFLRAHDPIGPFDGYDVADNESNRRDFVTFLYEKKHDIQPTLQQKIQGSFRIQSLDPMTAWKVREEERQRQEQIQQMLQQQYLNQQGGGNNNNNNNNNNNTPPTPITQPEPPPAILYGNNDGAINFTMHMVFEEPIISGKAEFDLLWNAPKKRYEFQTAAAMLALWQDNLVDLDQAEINKYSSMPMASQIQAMMKDYRYRSRFAGMSISKEAEEVASNAPDWKYLPWLGYYTDRSFPWIYHIGDEKSTNGLGWVYVQAPTSKEAWFYISGIGWMWSSESIWKSLSTYKPTANETWSLLPLYDSSAGNWVAYVLGSSSGRLFYDYAQQKFIER